MPYEIKRVGTYYCVVNKETGKKFSEHHSEEKAKYQIKLLEGREHNTIAKPESRTVKYKQARGIGGIVSNIR